MSFNKSVSPLSIKLRASRWLLSLLSALFLGALLMISIIDIPVWLMILLIGGVILCYVWSLALHGWIDLQQLPDIFRRYDLPRSIHSVVFGGDGTWQLIFGDGCQADASLTSTNCVTPFLTILNFRLQDKPIYSRRRAVILLPDAIGLEDFRRLRFLLATRALD